MGRFRKKPVVIEAFVWNPNKAGEVDAAKQRGWKVLFNGTVVIPTLEGQHIANVGDWIICGIKGEFYPCKPDIFEATYEPAEGERDE